ncbi:hypothetical protein EJ08DRAFT_632712 [Tothia fuscella]|uniref:DDHD domain-containing protein n=1 Tax=Tothia fuscella TaxID=1048955 RepID=A0A9P4NRY4_9PEZI|nr:hypothetical protein EJ08DRAFT_632712 [Tothia fuscella]
MASYNRYVREAAHASEPPPTLAVRYFFTSSLAIDDPLSPVPPPLSSGSSAYRVPPRPFSTYDNATLDKEWLDIRRKKIKLRGTLAGPQSRQSSNASAISESKRGSATNTSAAEAKRRSLVGSVGSVGVRSIPPSPRNRPQVPESPRHRPMARMPSNELLSVSAKARSVDNKSGELRSVPSSLRALDPADSSLNAVDTSTVTGNPFARAPIRSEYASSTRSRSNSVRPNTQKLDSYNWGDDRELIADSNAPEEMREPEAVAPKPSGPSAKVPVGVSRLHEVIIPDLQMEPIYWSPVNDIASVVRATWFYADTMLPVEVDVANMIEAGYVELRAWSETWKDELKSATEVGAAGEMKILHKLWPERSKNVPNSRPGTSRGQNMGQMLPPPVPEHDPEKERVEMAANAGDLIDLAVGPDGPDNKAAGAAPYGRDGTPRKYLSSGIIYANERDAYILRPNLQPSVYYGRRPLANYIRKGNNVGIRVVRGFDQKAWDKLYPKKKTAEAAKAYDGVSSSQAGISPEVRAAYDSTLSSSSRPQVTDLVLVIHGIGQKLSERVESYHFTHAINAFRREANVELGTNSVKAHLRPDLGGIMILPVNWRLTLSFEEGGYKSEDQEQDPSVNSYTLKDITPDTLPSVRNIVSDVMLDIPYYLSREHNPKMIAAVTGEANRIYRLWCANNPGFAEWGRVHIIAHSLGSVMAIDILSHQPTHVSSHLGLPKTPVSELPKDHFIFDTKSLFVCGSPSGFFLLLKKATLLPRVDRDKPGADGDDTPGVAGEQGTYGCLAVDNIYNIVNPYDPVAYRLNAAVDATYASTLKAAFVPSRTASWFANPFTRSQSSSNLPSSSTSSHYPSSTKRNVTRLPSNVELETHNFTREEIAEKRAYLLNDNGQIDYFLKYGGGALEIQYLTMLGAHSSYWISRDFVGFVVQEVGRRVGREGTLPGMRAVKKKIVMRDGGGVGRG